MTDRTRDGGGARPGAAPSARAWRERLDDPDEPLFTIAVASDLLCMDVQTLRRLGAAISRTSARPSGNQRRYSRNDLIALDAAARLADEGYAPNAIARILSLEAQVRDLTDDLDSR